MWPARINQQNLILSFVLQFRMIILSRFIPKFNNPYMKHPYINPLRCTNPTDSLTHSLIFFTRRLVPVFWTSGDVSSERWAALFALGIHFTYCLRFTSRVTPANLLMAKKNGSCEQTLLGLETRIYHATAYTVRGQVNRRSTEWVMLARLRVHSMQFSGRLAKMI